MYLSPPPPHDLGCCPLVVVLMLLIYCLLLLPLFVGVLCMVFVFILLFSPLCPSSFAIILMEKRGLVVYL